MDATNKLALSVPEAAQLLGVSVPLVYELVKRDDFPVVRIGKRTLVNRRLLEVWLDAQAAGQSNGNRNS